MQLRTSLVSDTLRTFFWLWISIADESSGKYPTYLRAPYSDCNTDSACHADVKALGYHLVHYDLSTEDYRHAGPDQIQQSKDIVKELISNAPENGNVLALQHDSILQSTTNLTEFILHLVKDKGWKGMLDPPFPPNELPSSELKVASCSDESICVLE